MNKMEIYLKDMNIYIVAKKFLDKNYGHLLAKNECFEINRTLPEMFWFKIVNKKGLISNIKERNKILGNVLQSLTCYDIIIVQRGKER